MKLKPVLAICTYHQGEYTNLGEAYGFLMKYIEENVFEILGKEKPLLKITSNSSIEILRQKQKVIYSIVNEAIEIVHQAKTIELTISKEEVEIKNEPKRIELNISSNELEIITKAKNIEFIINKEEIEIIHQKTINNYQIASDNNHVEYLSQEKQPIVLTIDNKEQISYKNIPKLIEIDTSNKISLEIESEHINKPIIYTIDNNESFMLANSSDPTFAGLYAQSVANSFPILKSSAGGYGYFNGTNLSDAKGNNLTTPEHALDTIYKGDYIALYFQGMMITMGYYAAGSTID